MLRPAIRLRRLLPFLAVAIAMLALPRPSQALDRGVLVYEAGGTVSKEYPGLAINDGGASRRPDRCSTLPSCDTIKLQVNGLEPFIGGEDDYFVRITLDWRNPDQHPDPEAETDLDMYVYDKFEATSTTQAVAKGASSAHPEKAALARPEKGEFWIVVGNWAGVNRKYRITVEWFVGAIPDPVEDLGPQRNTGGSVSGGGNDTADDFDDKSDDRAETTEEFVFEEPEDLSAAGDAAASPPSDPGPPAPLAGDDAFAFSLPDAGSGSGSGFVPAITGQQESTIFDFEPAADTGPAPDVHPALLLFWFVLVPLATAGGVGAILIRRRPVALAV